MLICAIDPGLKGAIALYDTDLGFLHTVPMPTRWKLVANKKRFEIDAYAFLLELLKWPGIEKVLVEEPQAMPGMGATSSFTFGTSCGTIYGVLEAWQHLRDFVPPILRVFPAVWKTAMKVPSDKNRAREAAAKIFPVQAKEQWNTQAEEGRAEAALLAWYAANVKEIKQKERTPYVKGQRKPTKSHTSKVHSQAKPKKR